MNIDELMNLPYQVSLYPLSEEDGGGWFAEIPDLPGCGSDGETENEALANVMDAKHEWLLAALETGKPIPKPTPVQQQYSGRILVRAPKSLHRRLVHMAKIQGVSLNQLAVYLLTRGVEVEQQAVTVDDSARSAWRGLTPTGHQGESPDGDLKRIQQLMAQVEAR